MTPTVLYLGPQDAMSVIEDELGTGVTIVHASNENETMAALPDVAAILDASMRIPLAADRLAHAPHLRVVSTATTGADHIDAAALAERDIPLLTLRGQTALLAQLTPAAEHSWLLLMATARQLPAAVDTVRAGSWDRTQHPGTMLRGKTLGIIGMGRIGGWMARYAHAFDMQVLAHDPHADTWPDHVTRTGLDDLLQRSDFVSIHVPLLEDTKGLLGRPELERMKPGAILINTSRGDIVDEQALIDLLESGHIGGAGLDVLQGEPDTANHPLLALSRTHPRVVITPHIGGFSPEAVHIVVRFAARRIANHLGLGGGT